jgi:hypothetical protein
MASPPRGPGPLTVVVIACACLTNVAVGEEDGPLQQELDGPAAIMTARGFERYEGAWRTPQEIALRKREGEALRARGDAAGRLRRLRARLDDAATAAEAMEEIRESIDPFAVAALAEGVMGEPDRRVRSLYLESLGRIRSPEAVAALVGVAVDHPDRETRYLGCEQLAAAHAVHALELLVAAVGGPDNARLNRAAAAAGWLVDLADIPVQSTTLERLVAALETSHAVVSGGDASTTATLTPSGGGLSLGGGPRAGAAVARNAAVLEALVTITGVDFGYERGGWRNWLATLDLPTDADLRRDP